MKKILLRFILTYLLFVIAFILQKVVFMLYYHKVFANAEFPDYLDVIWNGLPLDFATAGYLTIVPGVLYIANLWIFPHLIRPIFKGYFAIISLLLAAIFTIDLVLYEYWGFRLDSTPFFYFFSSPKDALASSGYLPIVAGILSIVLLSVGFYVVFSKLVIAKEKDTRPLKNRGKYSWILLLLTALLFIPIRGGFTVSTMNLSKAYYSENMYLNHAAINPCFSLLESLTREKNFDKQYRFMTPEKADVLFRTIEDQPVATDSLSMSGIPDLFTTNRPNILFIILESFLPKAMSSLGGLSDVAVNMDELAEEGILFTNFYGNSFRTDRGLVSLLSGYPAQPTTSIMKYPKKAQSLPSIPRALKEQAGYDVQYYYGGDADFTNMRAYLISMGITQIISDKDFPISERLSKWGAHDHLVFNRLTNDLKEKQREPFMKILQTSSSHEPFAVPYKKLEDPFLNSVAYTDSCLGDFISRFKETEWWDNSLIILVPDHARRYPDELPDLSFERFQIPFVLAGGVIKEKMRIDTYASQVDIAATLLYQLGIPHQEFTFSKNILNPASPHFAFFTYPNVFGMLTSDNQVIFDCESNKAIVSQGENPNNNIEKGKALLQKLYDDLASR